MKAIYKQWKKNPPAEWLMAAQMKYNPDPPTQKTGFRSMVQRAPNAAGFKTLPKEHLDDLAALMGLRGGVKPNVNIKIKG